MAGCRLETVILGLIGGEMLITPPSLRLDYTLPVCCQPPLPSCNHWKLKAAAEAPEQTGRRRGHAAGRLLLDRFKNAYLTCKRTRRPAHVTRMKPLITFISSQTPVMVSAS